MAEERYVYRRAGSAPPARKSPAANTPPPRRPAPPKRRRKRRPVRVLVLCLVCVLLAAAGGIALVRCGVEESGPAVPNFGTAAPAWQKNELGYYFNSAGSAIPAAVLKGMDVSRYQGEVDWEKAKAAGIDYAILRCGFGGEWDGQEENWDQDDPQFRRNADECTRLGIPFGVYLYSYATTVDEARSEADHVARLLGLVAPAFPELGDYTAAPYQLSYPVYYDLEDKYITKVLPDEMAEIVQAFFDRLTEHGYAGKQGLYASLNWVRSRFSDPAFDPWRENLWIARFSDEPGYTGTYDMWQCSCKAVGADYGVESETVDLNLVMRPFVPTGIKDCISKFTDAKLVNDTRQWELHLANKDDRATLTTSRDDTETQNVFWTTSNKNVATVDKNGTVRARTDAGECILTATLADGTESFSCIVRVGDVTVPIFATAGLQGSRDRIADAAAQKAGTPDAILVDAGNSLHGTPMASMTGGMDMMSAFSAAGYDLQAVSLWDMAYGNSRLLSDANMAAGPTLASNLQDANGTPVLYRSTSWNRNKVTDGQTAVIERAGYRIGFFSLNEPNGTVFTTFNSEGFSPADFTENAARQIEALQKQGVDAIVCIASTAPADSGWQKALLKQGVDAIITTAATADSDRVLAAGLGTDGLARLDLTFTQGGGCTVTVQPALTAAELDAARTDLTAAAATARDSEDDPTAPTERADEAPQKAADAYVYAEALMQGLDLDDQSIWNTTLFTFAENTAAKKTITFGNYVAALYSDIAAAHVGSLLPEGTEVTALACGVTEPAFGEISRGALIDALPQSARIQLIKTDAETAKTLAALGERTYLNSLTEFAPEGDTYLVTDSVTLSALDAASYTVLQDYGDVFWAVRMNINDLTSNFQEPFTLPEAPSKGVGRR